MKKFFAVLGVIFLVLIALGAIGFGFFVVRGNALDKESRAYADAVIPVIVGSWSDKELLDRASPEFKRSVSPQYLFQLFHRLAGSLGRVQKCQPAQGQSITTVTYQDGMQIKAEYTAKATFDQGEGIIDLALIKHGDKWQILGFFIKSPALPLH